MLRSNNGKGGKNKLYLVTTYTYGLLDIIKQTLALEAM